MTDWMNELEGELQAMQPRFASRDLVTAALVAHRDSEVLRAVRLRNELTPDQLESVLLVLADSYPELIAGSSDEAGSVALAFVRTPQAEATRTSPPATTSTNRAGSWVRGLVMAAALLLCFVGGMVTGGRPSVGDQGLVARAPEDVSGTTVGLGSTTDASDARSKARPESGQIVLTAPEQPGIRVETRPFNPQHLRHAALGSQYGRSSLADMNAEYQRRLHASRTYGL